MAAVRGFLIGILGLGIRRLLGFGWGLLEGIVGGD